MPLIPGFALTAGNIGGALGMLKGLFGGGGDEAAERAEGLSEEQIALLRQAAEMGEEWLPDLLSLLWQQAEAPHEDPWERALWQRTRGEIEAAHRPGYATGLEDLSRRHMLTEPSSVLGPYTASMDRSRAGAVSQALLARMAGRSEQRQDALQLFSNALNQARAGSVGVAQAYGQPIGTYGRLAESTGAAEGGWMGDLYRLYELQKQGQAKKKLPGSTGPNIQLPGYQPPPRSYLSL